MGFDYRNRRFSDRNFKYIKHLELEVDGYFGQDERAAESAVDTIQHIVKCGVDLRTFELVVNERDGADDAAKRRHSLFGATAASQELMAALASLNVSKTLTVSLFYKDDFYHGLQKSSDDETKTNFKVL